MTAGVCLGLALDGGEAHGRALCRSQIASASAAPFFCRLTNGLTLAGGMSRASCPSLPISRAQAWARAQAPMNRRIFEACAEKARTGARPVYRPVARLGAAPILTHRLSHARRPSVQRYAEYSDSTADHCRSLLSRVTDQSAARKQRNAQTADLLKRARTQPSLGIRRLLRFAINPSVAAPGFPKRTAAFPVKRRAHADLCVNLPGCPLTKRAPVLRSPSVPRGERRSHL
jgi:hypothetical protein